jgi:hypothetical protein
MDPASLPLRGARLQADTRDDKDLELISARLQELRNCRLRADVCELALAQPRVSDLDCTSQLLEIQRNWLAASEDNYRWHERDCTLSDAHFHTLCTTLSRSHAKYRKKMCALQLPRLAALLAVASCRHGPHYANAPEFELETMLQCIAPFVVQHLASGPTMLRMHIAKTLQDRSDLELASLRLKETMALAPEKQLVSPHLELETSWLRLQIKHANDEKAAQKVLDLDVAGFLFRSDLEHCSESLVCIASRYFAHVVLEQEILKTYPVVKHDVSEGTLQRFHDWIARQGRLQTTDKFQVNVREFACEMLLPLGARLQTLRNRDTRHQVFTAQSLLLAELGMHIVSEINTEFLAIQFEQLSTQTSHHFFDFYALCMVDYWLVQRMRFSFLEQYVITSSQLCFAKKRELFTAHTNRDGWCDTARRPRLAHIQCRWYVQHAQQIYECDSASVAVLQMLQIVHRQYAGTLDDDSDISKLTKEFFDAAPAVVPARV